MTRREKLYKSLVYGLFLLLCLLLQRLYFGTRPLWGLILCPIPACVYALASVDNVRFGIFLGLAAGLVMDTGSGSLFPWYGLMLMLGALLCGVLMAKVFRRTLYTALLLGTAVSVCEEALRFLLTVLLPGHGSGAALLSTVLPCALLSAAAAVPFIVILWFCCLKLDVLRA